MFFAYYNRYRAVTDPVELGVAANRRLRRCNRCNGSRGGTHDRDLVVAALRRAVRAEVPRLVDEMPVFTSLVGQCFPHA